MASNTIAVPGTAADSEGSGTRQHAFLRPLPGERRPDDAGPSPADGEGRVVALAPDVEVLTQLFPPDRDGSPGASAPDAAPGSVAGIRLGHFVIEERIGCGGMGAVFRAVDERLNRVVALKVLSPFHSRDPGSVDRFHNEAQAAARLDHENIARVHYIGEDRGVQFIAFEFVRGTNVRDFILQKGTISPQDAVNYMLQIAQALRHTMAAGVVHRDIKPSNIIITPAGHAKLVDLGLARQDRDQELTTFGTTLGTFDYIAPEQARDPRDVDVRADIYSLGCTLYHMLAGEAPFPRGNFIAKVIDHHRDTPPDPADRNPAVSDQLSRIVRKMMATNRDERYASPDHLIHDLGLVANALGLRPMHPDNMIWSKPLYEREPAFWENNRGWLLTVAALLVITLGIDRIPWQMLGGQDDVAAQSTPSVDGGLSAVSADPVRPDTDTVPASQTEADSGTAPAAPSKPTPIGLAHGVGGFPAPALAQRAEAPDQSTTAAQTSPESGLSRSTPADSTTNVADASLANEIQNLIMPLPAGPAARRTDVNPVTSAPAASSPFVVMDPLTNKEQSFDTLEAACQQAPNNGRIELRFTGAWPHAQPPIRIHNKRIVIAARPGERPVIEFQAATEPGRNDVTQMISITDGSLTLEDVSLVMPVKTALSERWSLFSLAEAESLDLRGVAIVVTNPQRLPAAVVEVVPPRNLDPLRMMPDSMMRRQVALDWQDCLIRGDCDLLVQDTLDPAELRCENVAVAVRGTLARVYGREALDGRVSDDRRLAIRLRQVTALLGEGLMRVETDLFREFTPLDFDCANCVVGVRPDQSLLKLTAHQDLDALRRRIHWQSHWSYFDVTGSVLEIIQEPDGEQVDFGMAALGAASDQLISEGLFADPLPWGDVDLATLPRRFFDQPRGATGDAAARATSAGVQWKGRIPLAGDRSVTSTSTPPIP